MSVAELHHSVCNKLCVQAASSVSQFVWFELVAASDFPIGGIDFNASLSFRPCKRGALPRRQGYRRRFSVPCRSPQLVSSSAHTVSGQPMMVRWA